MAPPEVASGGEGPLPVLLVFGTRPEAIKLAPVLAALRRSEHLRPLVLVTAQHRELLDQVLRLFSIAPDVDLDLMQAGQTLTDITRAVLGRLEPEMVRLSPRLVLVQGDTTTAMAAALAAFYARVPVAHVEAGLRTEDPASPFPEEMNRRLIGRLATLHFAPTSTARENLLREGVPDGTIFVTGNTGIDALLEVAGHDPPPPPGLPPEALAGRVLLLTTHRRENWGRPLVSVYEAVRELLRRFPDVQVVFSVHPNPRVQEVARRAFAGSGRAWLIPPPDYAGMVALLRRACLVLTDSGGLQEEAPALGRPVLVLRETTERPEGVRAGAARVVGTDAARIVTAVSELLSEPRVYRRMARAVNPYGDGRASLRIRQAIEHFFGFRHAPPSPFRPAAEPAPVRSCMSQ